MFGIGPLELVVVAIVAIVFIGPKNLPDTMNKIAKFFVKARRYSSDIKYGFDDMVRKAESEAGTDDLKNEMKSIVGEARSAKKEAEGQKEEDPADRFLSEEDSVKTEGKVSPKDLKPLKNVEVTPEEEIPYNPVSDYFSEYKPTPEEIAELEARAKRMEEASLANKASEKPQVEATQNDDRPFSKPAPNSKDETDTKA